MTTAQDKRFAAEVRAIFNESPARAFANAARDLRRKLWGEKDYSKVSPGEITLGHATKTLHVFIRDSRNPRHGELFPQWMGFPVEWHFGVGEALPMGSA